MDNPLFSVLIANYNNGNFLEEALESVFSQSYQNWEIVIVDDGSSDNSKDVLKIISDSRIRVYYNSKNRGCGFTKRKCVLLAKGEICGFLDPDDTLHPEALYTMVHQHLLAPDIALVYSTHFICNENLEVKKIAEYVGGIKKEESYLTATEKVISQFATFKRGKYLETEGINKNFKKAVDQDLYFKIEEKGRIYFFNQSLYYYRQHSGSISLFDNTTKAFEWHLKAMRNAYKRRKKQEFPQVVNINKKDLFQRHYNFYSSQAQQLWKTKNWSKAMYFLMQSLRFCQRASDLKILSLIIPLPLKKIIHYIKSASM